MLPKNRPPTSPGVMLLAEYLEPRKLTQVALAARMGVPRQRVNTLIHGKRGITAETAMGAALLRPHESVTISIT